MGHLAAAIVDQCKSGLEGFETLLFNTGMLYNLLVVYAFVQALVLILMLCSFVQRWSFDPKMGPIARVLWESLPELCHVGAVLAVIALMIAIMGIALFGDRAASFSSLAGGMKVMATFMVVGVMDTARAEILGNDNIILTPMESFSQEIFCFVLPFILKWIVAALVVSVLVQLFSTLRKKGDHAHSMVVAQIRTLLYEWWQCLFGRAPSNQKLLSTLFRLTGRRRTFHAIASIRSFVRRAARWTFFLSHNTKAAPHRSVKLHGELYSQNVVQVALEKLQTNSPLLFSNIEARLTPQVDSWLNWPKRFGRQVHPMPNYEWHRTSSSSSRDSDGDVKAQPSDLIHAAMLLLQDATLAGACRPCKPGQQQQSVGALAASDWGAFVRRCTSVQPRAASSRLLAMRAAVSSPSARMVFQSQALRAADSAHAPAADEHDEATIAMDLNLAMTGSEAKAQALEAASSTEAEWSMHAVGSWLASSQSDIDERAQQAATQTAAVMSAEPPGPVATLVQKFEDLKPSKSHAKHHGLGLVSLSARLANSPFSSISHHRKKRDMTNKARLKPLEIPGVTTSGAAMPEGAASIESICEKPMAASGQGAAARNDAAMAAHRARLHNKLQHKDQWAVAGRQTVARQTARPILPVPNARLEQDAPDSSSEEDADLVPERSSISAVWAAVRSHSPWGVEYGNPLSPRPPLRRFGSVCPPTSSQPSSPRSRPPAVTIAEIMRLASGVATPNDIDDSLPRSPGRMSARRPPAVTVAQIMRQNTRLSPLDSVPPSPSGWMQPPLSPRWEALPAAGGPPATPGRAVRLPPISSTHSGRLLSSGSATQVFSQTNRLLRWGTNNAAELAAAEDANAGAQLASAHSAAPPRLLRWGTSTAADPAAVGEGNAVAQGTSVDVTRQLQTDPVSTRDTERLLRWGTSTVADAAKLEQDCLQHHLDLQTEKSLTNSLSEPEQAVLPLLALQAHARSQPQVHDPVQMPQVLQQKQQHDLIKGTDKGKGKGIRGILSHAYLTSNRVAPGDAMQTVNKPGQQVICTILAAGDERAGAKPEVPARASQVGHATHDGSAMANSHSQMLPRAVKRRRHMQPSLHAALQQSTQQVRASISHLEVLSVQQQAMQKTLQSLIRNCNVVHDYILQMQQQKTGT